MWQYILNRLSEGTTWAGIVAFITGALGFTMPPEQLQMIISAGTSVVGLILFFTKQSKSPDAKVSPQAVSNGKAAA